MRFKVWSDVQTSERYTQSLIETFFNFESKNSWPVREHMLRNHRLLLQEILETEVVWGALTLYETHCMLVPLPTRTSPFASEGRMFPFAIPIHFPVVFIYPQNSSGS